MPLSDERLQRLEERYATARAGYNMDFQCYTFSMRSDVVWLLTNWLERDKVIYTRHGFTYYFKVGDGSLSLSVGHKGQGKPK